MEQCSMWKISISAACPKELPIPHCWALCWGGQSATGAEPTPLLWGKLRQRALMGPERVSWLGTASALAAQLCCGQPKEGCKSCWLQPHPPCGLTGCKLKTGELGGKSSLRSCRELFWRAQQEKLRIPMASILGYNSPNAAVHWRLWGCSQCWSLPWHTAVPGLSCRKDAELRHTGVAAGFCFPSSGAHLCTVPARRAHPTAQGAWISSKEPKEKRLCWGRSLRSCWVVAGSKQKGFCSGSPAAPAGPWSWAVCSDSTARRVWEHSNHCLCFSHSHITA